MGSMNALQYLLLFILLIKIEYNFGWPYEPYTSCLQEDNINDCVCKDMTKSGIRNLKCGSSYTIKEYTESLKKLNLPKNISMDIKFFGLNRYPNDIPRNVFEGLNIKRLTFDECNITKWSDEIGGYAFDGLEDTLESLNIIKSIIRPSKDPGFYKKEDAAFTVRHLRKLKEITLDHNTLWNFCTEYFGNDLGDSLEVVKLRSNKIWLLCDGSFANLKNLKQIDLSANRISEVTRSMFPNPASNLKEIDMHRNILSKLPKDLFTNMPVLERVILTSNHYLNVLDEATWRPVWSQLKVLEFEVSTLTCADRHIKWMFEVKSPDFLRATCAYPPERERKILSKIIKEKKKELEKEVTVL